MDFGDEEQLVAAGRPVAEVRELVGATSLAYLSLEGMQDAVRRPESAVCRACFTRSYPTPAPAELAKHRFEPTEPEPAGRVPAGLRE
jgi:amidophosphoribosyltransferase